SESEIAGGEIKLFVVKRIVRNVHLAVFSEITSIGVYYRAGVVIDASCPAFEEGSNDDNLLFLGDLREPFGCGTRNRFGKIEKSCIFCAAEILAAAKFVHAYDLRAACRSFLDFLSRARKIFFGIFRGLPLKEADCEFVRHAS